MMLSQRISIEQKQTLIMTPRLQQAIQLLQFSTLELSQYIEDELKSNPILEVDEESSPEDKCETTDEKDNNLWEEYLENSRYSSDMRPEIDYNVTETNYENFVAIKPCLTEFVLSQFNLLTNDREELEIGEYLIGSLDEQGFLSITPERASQLLEVSIVKVMKVIKMVQSLEPVGIGARNLIESLIIQSKYHYGDLPLVEEIIYNHLEELSENHIKQIASKLKVTPGEIQQVADIIKTLNPRPAALFTSDQETKYLEPDVFIQKVGDEYVVIMNDQTVPRLRINAYYQKIMANMQNGEEAREFLEKKLNSALWLIKSIEQRRMTIYRIVETMVELQKPFLDKGIKHLQPMTLNEVAERIGVHESTVSRATANKYVQTPYGIYELKFFFNSGISSNDGEGIASVGVKEIIQELIRGEDAIKPLSDQKIAEIIEERGFSISRRTVAKYRDELEIPASSKRRRYE